MNFKVTKRCIRCRKPLRDDGTCQNEKCVRYTAPKEETSTNTSTDTTTEMTDETKQLGGPVYGRVRYADAHSANNSDNVLYWWCYKLHLFDATQQVYNGAQKINPKYAGTATAD